MRVLPFGAIKLSTMGNERYMRNNRSKYRGKHNFRGRTQKKTYIHEQLTEVEVGISEYMNETKGFTGIIKARYSDFHVNEINLDGDIAKLINVKCPESFSEETSVVIDDLKEVAKPTTELLSDEKWKEIINMLELPEEKCVQLEVTDVDKDDRKLIHESIKKALGQKIVASTICEGNKKFISFKKYNKHDKTDRGFRWPENLGEYVHFLVYKESIDTMEAAFKISDCLKMKSALFTYAGVKDRRAKTTQWFCVRKVNPRKLLYRTRHLRAVRIGNITFKNTPLKLGQLKGNRFRIALRNVNAESAIISESLESLKEQGFINYYGLQRFGNDKEVPTFDIGIKLMQGNWKEACNLILKPKKSDDPFSDITKAKNVYQTTGNASKAYNELAWNKNKCLESKLLQGLSNNAPGNFVNALEKIPRNMRLLYIHAFQSLIWNKIVSRRIKEFGLKPIPGDIVLISGEQTETIEDQNELCESATETVEDQNDISATETSNSKNVVNKQEIKILDENDVENYTIYDIGLPLPGFDVKYPENAIKEWYKELLEGFGLSLEMHKQKVKTYTVSGAYRKLISKVQNLSWKTVKYNDPNDNLIRSDLEELNGEEEPQDAPDGKYTALIVDFCLNSSCYATMVLREILKMDTSNASHSKLNNYHETIKPKDEPKATTSDFPQPASLLANQDKFEEFKKAIFETTPSKRKLSESENGDNKTKKSTEKEVALKIQPSLI